MKISSNKVSDIQAEKSGKQETELTFEFTVQRFPKEAEIPTLEYMCSW